MEDSELERTIEIEVIMKYVGAGRGISCLPRYPLAMCICAGRDVETLFGKGYQLKKPRSLSQPDQFACEEQVTLVGPKGSIEKCGCWGRSVGEPRWK